jgi:hypothetical protein
MGKDEFNLSKENTKIGGNGTGPSVFIRIYG